MDSQIHDEDIVIFIGTTKSGKSSLINYLIGNKLIGKKNFSTMPVAIQKFDDSDGPQIGRDPCSETIVPSRWENEKKLPGLALWDAPGFNDNRGPIQDITNAYYIYKLFRNVRSVKIVLVTDINNIMNDSVHSFLILLNALEFILKEKLIDNFSSVVVIFTKVPEVINDNAANISNVCQLIKDQFFSNSEILISETSRLFLQNLIKGVNIGLFMKAKAGPISDSIAVGITDAIQKADSISKDILKQIASPSIAHESKVFLLEIQHELFTLGELYELQDVIENVCENFVMNYTCIQETEDSCEILESVIQELCYRADQLSYTLEPTTNFQEKLEILQSFDIQIANKIDADNLLTKSVLIEFVDSLLDSKEIQNFSRKLERIVHNVVQKIIELNVTIKFKINEIEIEEFNKQIQKRQEEYDQEMQELQLDIEENFKLNEIIQKDYEDQLKEFHMTNNEEIMEKLATERADSAKIIDDLHKFKQNMQERHLQEINELKLQLENAQKR